MGMCDSINFNALQARLSTVTGGVNIVQAESLNVVNMKYQFNVFDMLSSNALVSYKDAGNTSLYRIIFLFKSVICDRKW